MRNVWLKPQTCFTARTGKNGVVILAILPTSWMQILRLCLYTFSASKSPSINGSFSPILSRARVEYPQYHTVSAFLHDLCGYLEDSYPSYRCAHPRHPRCPCQDRHRIRQNAQDGEDYEARMLVWHPRHGFFLGGPWPLFTDSPII